MLSVTAHICNYNTQEAEADAFPTRVRPAWSVEQSPCQLRLIPSEMF